MESKLVRWGDDLAVRLSADEARALGVSEGQSVEILPTRQRVTRERMFAEMKRLGPTYEPETVEWGADRGSEIIDDDDPR